MAAEHLAPGGHGPAASPQARAHRPGRDGLFLTPPAILIIGVLATVAATWIAHSAVASRDRRHFRETVDEVTARVDERRRSLGLLTRSMAGMFGVDNDVTPAEFRAYVAGLNLSSAYAGIVSTGFAVRVRDDDLPALEQRLRADYGPNVSLHALGPGPEHYPAVLIQPETDGNLRFLGFDLSGEPLRAAVLQRAAEVGGPATSQRLEFIPDTAPEPRIGYIIACPVYRAPAAPAAADTPPRLSGFVFSACRAHDLLGELVHAGPGRLYRLTIYDGAQPDPRHILYADGPTPAPARSPLISRRTVEIHHRPWTLEFSTTRAFEASSAAWFIPILAAGGVALSAAAAGASLTGVRAGAAIQRLLRRLRRSERTLQRITQSGLVGIAVFDRRRVLREFNDAFLDLFGYTRGDLLTRHITIDDLAPEGPASPEHRAALAAGRSIGPIERECVRRDGSRITVLAGAGPLTEEGDIIAFAVDVTAQRRAEAEVRRLNATLEAQVEQRTAELRDLTGQLEAFARNVSHDLRAPLRAIEGFATIVQERLPPEADEQCRHAAARIADAAARMERMILGLLEISRLARSRLPLEPVPLADAAAEALAAQSQPLRAAGADVRTESGMPAVLAHRQVLVQALSNLVGNAAKFVPPGERPRVTIRAEQHDGTARLIVEDAGIGLPPAPEARERIFRPFARLHGREAYEGTGLGLAMAKAGVERMGGRIGVEDNPGGGSRFWIELPLASAGSDTSSRSNAEP